MEGAMELRHLRYFVAVAEAGSLTVAAEKKLHTAQPSLSRQIRNLEYEVGVQLMSRSVHGIELTAACAYRKSNPDILVVPVVNQIRLYWWRSPPRTGRQRMLPARSTARETGASFF